MALQETGPGLRRFMENEPVQIDLSEDSNPSLSSKPKVQKPFLKPPLSKKGGFGAFISHYCLSTLQPRPSVYNTFQG